MPGLAQSGLDGLNLSRSESFEKIVRAKTLELGQSHSMETLPEIPTPRRLDLTPDVSLVSPTAPGQQKKKTDEQYPEPSPSPVEPMAPAVETPAPAIVVSTQPENPVLPGAPPTSRPAKGEGKPGESGKGGEEPEGTMYTDGTYWKTHNCNIYIYLNVLQKQF